MLEMVRTRGSGDVAGAVKEEEGDDLLSENQENEDIGRKLRKRTSDGSNKSIHLSSSDLNVNGQLNNSSNSSGKCNSVEGSIASNSIPSNVGKEQDSDDTIEASPQKKTFQRGMAYRRHFEQEVDDDDGWMDGSSQGNVRRSTRKRTYKYTSMNENMFGYEIDDMEVRRSNRARPSQSLSHSPSVSLKRRRSQSSGSDTDQRVALRYQTRRSLRHGAPDFVQDQETISDHDDMYSRIKANRRRTAKRVFCGDSTDSQEDTEMVKQDELGATLLEDGTADEPAKEVTSTPKGDKIESSNTTGPTLRRRPQRILADSSDSEEEKVSVKQYFLRPKRPPVIEVETRRTLRRRPVESNQTERGTDHFRKFTRHRSHRKPARHGSSTSDSSASSDEERFERRKANRMAKARSQCLPLNFKRSDLMQGSLKERMKVGSSLADIEPMTIDTSITFESIGGLDRHLNSLKEMIIFPLLYPEVFDKFKVQVPRGVLFYGPPGTGKTLVARALANECSTDGKKVAFFMRKGADCMSKWVGESERQLRLLFDQAYTMRPSIIFFDEIDGIAPVRSTRQDQIHSSIVSTLLALMDGLDSRGEVIVIGATNRLEAIDPALRRPGRFDREFFFPLPSFEARKHIISIHTKSWNPSLTPDLTHTLAERTVGYCGADLKALCSEAVLLALKRRYQQIYTSKNKLKLDYDSIQVTIKEFNTAINRKIIPASQRSLTAIAKPLPVIMRPLLLKYLNEGINILKAIFPCGFKSSNAGRPSDSEHESEVDEQLLTMEPILNGSNRSLRFAGTFRPRILISGDDNVGQMYTATALLQEMEQLNHFKVDSTQCLEELTTWFSEAVKKLPVASALYVPKIEDLTDNLFTHLCSLLEGVDATMPLLFIATAEESFEKLPSEVVNLFSPDRFTSRVLPMSKPTDDERKAFLLPLFKKLINKPIEEKPVEKLEELEAVSVAPHRTLNEKELQRLRRKEESSLRQLRNFLRDMLSKIVRDKRFSIFLKPVDLEEVPDYHEVIQQPMDLETMMFKIDAHIYESAAQFLGDIELITNNALEYNPNRDSNDKLIRHRACALRDFANAIIDAEMDSDFEQMCQEMHRNRADRGESPTKNAPKILQKPRQQDKPTDTGKEGDETEIESLHSTDVSKLHNSSHDSTVNGSIADESVAGGKSVVGNRRRGKRKGRRNVTIHQEPSINEEKEPLPTDDPSKPDEGNDKGNLEKTDEASVEQMETSVVIDKTVKVDSVALEQVLEEAVQSTKDCSMDQLENLYWLFFRTIKKRLNEVDRSALHEELKKDLSSFREELSMSIASLVRDSS